MDKNRVQCASKPRCGIHALRIPIIDHAFWDVFFTVLFAIGVARLTNANVWISIAFMFIVGVVCHYFFEIRTQLNTYLFGKK